MPCSPASEKVPTMRGGAAHALGESALVEASDYIRPHGSAPASLGSLFLDFPEPFRDFCTFSRALFSFY